MSGVSSTIEPSPPSDRAAPIGARPEYQAVLGCALPDEVLRDAEGELRAALEATTDWQLLRDTALRHGVIGLLYRRIARKCPDAVPEAVLGELRSLYQVNSRRNLRLGAQLVRILGQLHERGIMAVPIKGPMLAQYLYGDVGARQSVDLDVLVRKDDVVEVREALAETGLLPCLPMDSRYEAALLRWEGEYAFKSPDGGLLLESALDGRAQRGCGLRHRRCSSGTRFHVRLPLTERVCAVVGGPVPVAERPRIEARLEPGRGHSFSR